MTAAPRACVCLSSRQLAEWLHHPDLGQLEGPRRHWVELRADRLGDWHPGAWELICAQVGARRLVVTCRDSAEGGSGGPALAQRWRLWASALEAGVPLVDVELAQARAAPRRWQALLRRRRRGSRLMLSAHLRAAPTHAQLMALWRACGELGADVCKVAAPIDDAWGAVPFLAWAADPACRRGPAPLPVPLGPAGTFVRLLMGQLSPRAPLSYAASASPLPPPLDDGQLPWPLMRHIYRAHQVGPTTPVWAIIGGQVADAYSPLVHSTLLAAAGRPGIYVPVSVRRRPAALVAALAPFLRLQGLSVTAPHKQAMVSACQRLSAPAAAAGAVNTMVRGRGRGLAWQGSNVDGEAVVCALRARLGRLGGQRVVVVGTGGLGRAAATALARAGARVQLLSRSPQRGRAVAHRLGVGVCSRDALGGGAGPAAVLNATPQGEAGGPAPASSPLSVASLSPDCWVVEGVYRPRTTPLLRAAAGRGLPTCGGAELFVLQAAAQARRFFGLRCTPSAWLARLAAPSWAELRAAGPAAAGAAAASPQPQPGQPPSAPPV